jgi:hypothetical protein
VNQESGADILHRELQLEAQSRFEENFRPRLLDAVQDLRDISERTAEDADRIHIAILEMHETLKGVDAYLRYVKPQTAPQSKGYGTAIIVALLSYIAFALTK